MPTNSIETSKEQSTGRKTRKVSHMPYPFLIRTTVLQSEEALLHVYQLSDVVKKQKTCLTASFSRTAWLSWHKSLNHSGFL